MEKSDDGKVLILWADKDIRIFPYPIPASWKASQRIVERLKQGRYKNIQVKRKKNPPTEVKEPWFSQGPACSICGIPGVHACPGYKLPKPTEEDERRLHFTLNDIFGVKRSSPEDARQRTLDAVKKYRDASAEVERICKENGYEVPIMVMESDNANPTDSRKPVLVRLTTPT